jgi:hypothetical protein
MNISSEFVSFEAGVDDAKSDMRGGWLPTSGPSEAPAPASLEYIVNELKVGLGASDSYIAGYLSVVFGG